MSFLDGIFAYVMIGMTTQNLWVACAEALKVSPLKAVLVSTLPNLICSIAQIFSGRAAEKLGRLKTIKIFIALQWISLLPLAFIAAMPMNIRYGLILIFAITFALGGAFPHPSWLSLMSDHLPANRRGKYLGWRNAVLGAVALGCGILAGQILQHFRPSDVFLGFTVIFTVALVCRITSWLFIIRMYDIPLRHHIVDDNGAIPDSFFKFILTGQQNHFGRFVFFVAAFSFSVNLVGPYLTVYMLRDLHFSYLIFTIVTLAASLTALFGGQVWGNLADRFGNLRVIRATSAFVAIIPLLWFSSAHPLWLIAIQCAAGFAWAGIDLCVSTYAFAEIPSSLRARAISYLHALNGIAIFAGSYLGGVALKFLPEFRGSAFMGLFVLSALLRLFCVLFLLQKLKERHTVQPVSTFDLYLNALGINPMLESGREFIATVLNRKK